MNSNVTLDTRFQIGRPVRLRFGLFLLSTLFLMIPSAFLPLAGQEDQKAETNRTWSFVSTPDLFNVDVGDLRDYPDYRGSKNSMTPTWRKTTGRFLDFLKAEQPEFVAVAGDLVMARWHQGAIYEGVFGPMKKNLKSLDLEEEKQRVRNAADFYFGKWNKFFTERGLKAYPAVGDHELGDDYSWSHPVAVQTVPTHRERFAHYFVDPIRDKLYSYPESGQHKHSVYAIRHKNLLLISVDVFHQPHPEKPPRVEVGPAQLQWLEQVLNRARTDRDIDHVIVQGHTPVLFEGYNIKANVSGTLHLNQGKTSPFWKLMKSHQVDLYLTGEVHAENVNQDGRDLPLQITHGGLFGFKGDKQLSFLRVKVFPEKLKLTMKSVDIRASGKQFFQPGNPTTKLKKQIRILGTPGVKGTLTIDKSGSGMTFRNQSGVFTGVSTPGK